MKICKTDLHVIIEEHEKPRVAHQQGQLLLNYDSYYKGTTNMKGLIIDFKNLEQIKQTIEVLEDLVKKLEENDERSIEIFFDEENCRRYKF